MSTNRENIAYKVNVEFAKFSKRFDFADDVKIDNASGVPLLVVTTGNTEHHFNLDKVDYYEVREVTR